MSSLEFLIINKPLNDKIIENYRTFHELNHTVLRQIYSLDKDVEAVLSKQTSPKNLTTQYQELYSNFDKLIKCAKHLSNTKSILESKEDTDDSTYDEDFDLDDDDYRFSCFSWEHNVNKYTSSLEKLNKELKSVVEQIQFYCKMGYQESVKDARGDSVGQANSDLNKQYLKFRKILLWSGSKNSSYDSTFEGLLREIHSHYYTRFNKVIIGNEPTNICCIDEPIVVPYFTSTNVVNPTMQNIIDLLNNLDKFNKRFNVQKSMLGYDREVETALVSNNLKSRFFTDETAHFSIKPSMWIDHRIYLDILHDSVKDDYRINWHIGTKDTIPRSDHKIYDKVFSSRGWFFDKKLWNEKDLRANIVVKEEGLKQALVTAFVLSEWVAGNLKNYKIEDGNKLVQHLDKFYKEYSESSSKP